MSLLRELWMFLRARKKMWLLPLILVMLLVGTVLEPTLAITHIRPHLAVGVVVVDDDAALAT